MEFSELDAVKGILKKHRAQSETFAPQEAMSRNIAATQLEKEALIPIQKQIEHRGVDYYSELRSIFNYLFGEPTRTPISQLGVSEKSCPGTIARHMRCGVGSAKIETQLSITQVWLKSLKSRKPAEKQLIL